MYFATDSCGDTNEFKTADEARKAAENYLEQERDNADEGWSEHVTHIRWGRIMGQVQETMREPVDHDDPKPEHRFVPPEFDEVVDYAVVTIHESNEIPPLDEDTRWILGRPNFWCASVAQVLREDGHVIPTRAEEEQAAVIYWMFTNRAKHGDDWRTVLLSETARITKKVADRATALVKQRSED